jgi:hypothetical protein
VSVSGLSVDSESLTFIDLADSISGLSAMSIGFWIYGVPGSRMFGNGWNQCFQVYCSSSDVRIYLNLTTGGVDVTAAGDLLAGDTWKHVLITWAQNGTLYIYVNGVVGNNGASGDFAIAASAVDIRLFREGAGNYGSGVYEDLAIWDRQLTVADALSLYGGRLSAAFIPNGLLAHYALHVPGDAVYEAVADGDLGLIDLTGQQVAATIEAAPEWSQNSPSLHWPSRPAGVLDAVSVEGPFDVQAQQLFAPGAATGEAFSPGSAAGEVFAPGAVAAEIDA